ncbi:4-amino-4-deoxy-L-arabinose transferase [Arenibacter nanhaiticus]|uniref:4-amino-4-deoxy-L-arabinose transferase n=1 Tax=Arenibacter nanhaiticus TaxID=558155 RepID=A0A1M6JBF4_9FLAO|nr:glycosyltransferase family 39 protein [Arenibacter nanhaiticus]SHJ43990.1 4-amino-4-deoxy-L-arabinose transferase [Arenibacter nanhaiticus]
MNIQKIFYWSLIPLFLLINIGLGSWGLTESSEARYAEISREMVLNHEYLHPTLLGIKHYHKPPITYYITVMGYQIFGINEYGARFFLSVALVFQLLLVFKISKLLFNDLKVALAAAIIYFSFPIVLIAARVLTTDAYMATFVIWSVYWILCYKKNRAPRYLYGFFIVLALAFLTKGPVAVLPVVIFLVVWKVLYKETIALTIHHYLGFVLCLLLSSSWFLAVMTNTPHFLDYLINDQIIARSLTAEKFHRNKPFWYYLILAPLVGFPWLPIMVVCTARAYKKYLKNKTLPLVLLWTIGSLFILFSAFSSKLVLYILPLFSFMAILSGYLFFLIPFDKIKNYSLFYGLLIVVLSLFLILGDFIMEIRIDVRYSLMLAVFLILGLGILYYNTSLQRHYKLMAFSLLFTIGLVLSYPLFGSKNPNTINTIKNIVALAKEKKGDSIGHLIALDVFIPSASFYLNQDIITVKGNTTRVRRDIQFEEDTLYRENLLDISHEKELRKLQQLMQAKNTVLLVRKKDTISDFLCDQIENFKHQIEIDQWRLYY